MMYCAGKQQCARRTTEEPTMKEASTMSDVSTTYEKRITLHDRANVAAGQYWTAHECADKPIPRKEGASGIDRIDDACLHRVTLFEDRRAYADYDASNDCGCTQNGDSACW